MSSETRKGFGCCGLIVLLVIAAVAFVIIHHNSDIENFDKGHQAYLQSDCATALNYYDRAVNTWRFFNYGDYRLIVGQEGFECQLFLEGVDKQQANDFSGAMLAYNSFVSDHAASPLVDVARTNVKSIFTENKPADFVNEDLCKQIDKVLINDLIPQPGTNLPPVYFACGQLYENTEVSWLGIDYFERFLSGYPDHPLAPEVKSALIRAIVARAKLNGTSILPTPEQSGTTDDGSTVVLIRNESPESLRIVLSGPESRIEQLEACSACSTFSTSPSFCPGIGPVGRYTIKPGQYFVVVESTSDTGTTPWSGDWILDSGFEYTNSFFIIKGYRFGW